MGQLFCDNNDSFIKQVAYAELHLPTRKCFIIGVAVNGRYLIGRIDIREGEARFTLRLRRLLLACIL